MVVPEGWEQVELDEIAIIGDGLHGTPEYDNNGKYFFINGNNLQNGHIVIDINTKRVNHHTYEKLGNYFSLDTIFMSINGTIGNMAYFNDEMIVIGKSIAYFHITKKISKNYLFFYLQSHLLLQYFHKALTGSTIKNLGLNVIRKASLLLPPLSEQRRIAEVLSDTDAYIHSLKKLITKKEAVKQGVMQELLTGKKRLPGFSGAWIEKRLGEISLLYKGSGLSKTKITINGIYPCILYGELFTEYNEIIKNIVSKTNFNEGVLSIKGDILIPASTTTIGIDLARASALLFDNVLIGGDINIIRANPTNINPIFLAIYITHTRKIEISIRAKGTTVYHLHTKDLIDLPLYFPPTLAEQTAIANILSDMDQEIEALKKKLKKIEVIKQGMMQKLLTGEIRLLEETEGSQEDRHYKLKNQDENLYAAEKVERYKTTRKHSKEIDDAVVIAGIVNALYSPQYPLGRKKLQKCLYLLRRYQEQSTEEFKKKAAGPYADEIRYKGGEPLAIKLKYIISHKGTKGTIFSIGNNINQALEYIDRWSMKADIEWVKKTLKFEKVDKLELWATVDMAICDLKSSKIPISVSAIKNLIATNKEWSKKLEKPIFSDKNIAETITILQTLFIKR